MLDQRVLDFHRADPDTTDLEHVVAAAGVPQEPVGVGGVLVAGADPVALDGVPGLVMLVPIGGAGRIAFDQQVANLTRGYRLPVVIDDLRLIPRDGLPR